MSEIATIWRILGNEMPPRDNHGRRMEVLKEILEQEPELEGAQKWYVVNRLANIPWRRCIVEMLDRHNAHYVTVPFDRSIPPNPENLKLRGVNINNARNLAIQAGHAMTPWSVVLDGDCIFTSEGWSPVIAAMRENRTKHLSIPHRREATGDLAEPMVAFHQTSEERFDESIPFGSGDKLELLYRLGHDRTPYSGHLQIEGDKTQVVGEVRHITTGHPGLESNLGQRERQREKSFQQLSRRIGATPTMQYTPHGGNSRVWSKLDGFFDYSGQYSSIAFDVHDGARIVEVGSWQGKSAIYLATQVTAFGNRAHIHCVDTFDGGNDEVLKSRIEELGGPDALFGLFNHNVKRSGLGYMITPHRKSSVEAAKEFGDNTLSAVFIDAGHSYEDVKADLEAWYPKVKPGGLFAGHDFDFAHPVSREGVIPAVREFFKGMPLEVMPYGRVWKHICYKNGDPTFPDSHNPLRRRRLWV